MGRFFWGRIILDAHVFGHFERDFTKLIVDCLGW